MTDLPYGQLRSETDSTLPKMSHHKKAILLALRQERIKSCSGLLSYYCVTPVSGIRKMRHFRTASDVSTRSAAMSMDNCMDKGYSIAIL